MRRPIRTINGLLRAGTLTGPAAAIIALVGPGVIQETALALEGAPPRLGSHRVMGILWNCRLLYIALGSGLTGEFRSGSARVRAQRDLRAHSLRRYPRGTAPLNRPASDDVEMRRNDDD